RVSRRLPLPQGAVLFPAPRAQDRAGLHRGRRAARRLPAAGPDRRPARCRALRDDLGRTRRHLPQAGLTEMTGLDPPRSAPPAERLARTGFELDGEVFALPDRCVERVLPATAVTALPFAPAGVEGVASISGDIIPVLALRILLAAARPQAAQSGPQFLVTLVSGRRFAPRIDR